MQFTRIEQLRAVFAALITVALAASAVAQPATRIGRNDTNYQDLDRRLQPGELGGLDSLSGTNSRGISTKPIDYSKVNKQALANLMKEAVDEAGRLYASLEQDYRRYPQLRPLLADLHSLRSLTSRLAQDMNAGIPLETIVVDFRRIDADWRVLAHRMVQSTGLSKTTLASVDRLNAIDKQVGIQFQVDPSLDYRGLISKLSVLESALYNISEELSYDLNGTAKTAQIVNDCRKMQQQITRVADLVLDQYPYDRIVSEYNRFERTWIPMREQLRTVNNPVVDRAVSRANQADSAVHELLWLETASDRVQMKQIADALIRNVDEFYSRTPLKLLLSFKNAANTLAIADDFYGTVLNLKDNLNRNESDEVLIESYRYVEESGAKFTRTFRTMQSQQGIVVLRQIEDGMAALRSELHLGGTVSQVDSRRLLPIAASLENLADQLDYDVKLWVNSERPAYRNEVLQASATFMARTQRMSRLMNATPTLTELQREADSLYVEWKSIYNYLSRCNTADRPYLSRTARDIISNLRDLDSQLRL